jgi:hypothetical protein
MGCRLLKPVYDGRTATMTAKETGGSLDINVESDGILCATATATLPCSSDSRPRPIVPSPVVPEARTKHVGEGQGGGDSRTTAVGVPPTPSPSPQGGGEKRAGLSVPLSIGDYPLRAPPTERPPADETSLAAGNTLGIRPFALTEDLATQYLRDVREADPIYAREGLAHPGQLLRLANLILRENVVLQPWVHTGSKVTNFAAARFGDELSARGKVSANYERKGHRLVDIDIILLANGRTVLAHVLHTAVYRLRQLAS